MSRPSIPDSIYNNRCRYCMHFTGLPNTTGELSTGQLFSCKPSTPCNIISIAKYCEQKIINYHPVSCTYAVHDNECFSFTPNYGYPGICDSCRYSNHFFDKSDYCSLPKEEITDRRPLLIGCTYSQRKTDYWTYASDSAGSQDHTRQNLGGKSLNNGLRTGTRRSFLGSV